LLPKNVRDDFKIRKAEPLYLIPNVNEPPCLEIRTQALWDEFCAALLEKVSGRLKKDLFRFVQTQHARVAPDGQGRIVIPEKQRSTCALDGDVFVVDMRKHIEVWSRRHIDTKYPDMIKAYRELSDDLF